MGFFDTVFEEAKEGATVLAVDWLRDAVERNRPQVETAPQPAATLPADVQVVQEKQNSLVLYIAIGVAVLGLVFMLFGGKKGGKR